MNTKYNGSMSVTFTNPNGLTDKSKGWKMSLIYKVGAKKHVIVDEFAFYGVCPDMSKMNVLVQQMNAKHYKGYFDKTLDIYFGNTLAIESKEDATIIKPLSLIVHGERVLLTPSTIILTRRWFAIDALGCYKEVEKGDVYFNTDYMSLEDYKIKCQKDHDNFLKGGGDKTLTFLQRAYFIQTGHSVPMFAD